MWVALVIAVVASAYMYANMPKPEAQPPATMSDVDVPTAEEGKSFTILFGTRVLKSPVVVWCGDFESQAIKEKP